MTERISKRGLFGALVLAAVLAAASLLVFPPDTAELLASPFHASSDWRRVRNEYLEEHPYCEMCHYTKGQMNVHHVIPVSVCCADTVEGGIGDPARALDPENLMTLCRPCHLRFGHCDPTKPLGHQHGWKKENRFLRQYVEALDNVRETARIAGEER